MLIGRHRLVSNKVLRAGLTSEGEDFAGGIRSASSLRETYSEAELGMRSICSILV